jgi:hypothetical protein
MIPAFKLFRYYIYVRARITNKGQWLGGTQPNKGQWSRWGAEPFGTVADSPEPATSYCLEPRWAIEILVLPQLSAPTAPSILIWTNSSQNSLQGWRPQTGQNLSSIHIH